MGLNPQPCAWKSDILPIWLCLQDGNNCTGLLTLLQLILYCRFQNRISSWCYLVIMFHTLWCWLKQVATKGSLSCLSASLSCVGEVKQAAQMVLRTLLLIVVYYRKGSRGKLWKASNIKCILFGILRNLATWKRLL